jgi:hypothetical protein
MNWEQVLINVGVTAAFFLLMFFWVGLALWMRVDADKRGITGWVWAFVGILTGPLGLIAYLLFRGNRPVLEVVHKRDEIIAANARAHAPRDYDPDAPVPEPEAENEPEVPPAANIEAALEAEQRRFRGN